MPRRRLAAAAAGPAAALAAVASLAFPALSAAQAAASGPNAVAVPSALVVFYGGAGPPPVSGLSLGLVSAAQQAGYDRTQFLLDAGQGARVGAPAYGSHAPPLRLAGARIAGWSAARRRAASAAGRLQPGLLASSTPGGGAYAGPPGGDGIDAVLAADRDGRIGAVARGGSLVAQIAALRTRARLVVADLPAGAAGRADLRRLLARREPGELLVALQRVRAGGELLWAGIAGFAADGTARAGGAGELQSASTQERGLVSAVDLAPTILAHLGAHVPAAMLGRTIDARGRVDPGGLARLDARLRVVEGRRLPALALLLGACALLAAGCARRPAARRSALRAGALALLWSPAAALAAAALQPGPWSEYVVIAALALALGAGNDRLLAWPRALAAPALAVPVAIAIDALAGTQLQMRSLAGPDPAAGARFFGIGNELKSALAAAALLGVAAALHHQARERRGRAAAAFALAGLALLVVEGWARIGAGVGGAVLVSTGFGLAAALMLARARGGTRVRRRGPWLVALASAPAGLALLIAVDLATARGRGHLEGSVLDARSLADVRDELVNRYATAWRALRDPAMALATAAALAVAAAGVRLRARLPGEPAGGELFAAAFAGGLLAGIAGALIEDSGPLLLVEAVLVLACGAVYLRAAPARAPAGPTPPAPSPATAYPSTSAAPSAAADRPTIAVLGGSQGTA